MKTIKVLILMAALLSFAFILFNIESSISSAWGLESDGFKAIDRVTYFGTTDKEVKVSWDHNDPPPDFYEINLYHVERQTELPAGTGKTSENSITFQLPRSGHFIAKVRACMNSAEGIDGCDAAPCCGEWSESIDSEVAIVDGAARAWWLYGYVAPVGVIAIDPNPY